MPGCAHADMQMKPSMAVINTASWGSSLVMKVAEYTIAGATRLITSGTIQLVLLYNQPSFDLHHMEILSCVHFYFTGSVPLILSNLSIVG